MKKTTKLLALVMLTGALSSGFASGADIIVLMDSSGTILPYFDEINDRILVDITKKFIREGDTFHLISFNARPNLEITQPIKSEADISKVVSRFMLLYPLGQNSDFLSALQYIWQYASSLDQQREKIVIVISDGIFNPPTASPYAAYSPEQVRSEIVQISRRIRGAGWNVYYIKLPFPTDAVIRTLDGDLLSTPTVTETSTANQPEGANPSSTKIGSSVTAQTHKPESERADVSTAPETDTDTPDTMSEKTEGENAESKQYYDVSTEFANALEITPSELPANDIPITFIDQAFAMPEILFPDDIGRKGRVFVLPLKVKNTSNASMNMELTGVLLDENVNVLAKTSFLNLSPQSSGVIRAEIHLPETILNGPQDLALTLQFSDNLRVIPQKGILHVNIIAFSFEMLFKTGGSILITAIFIIFAILLVILLFLFIIRKTSRPASDAIQAASTLAEPASATRTYASSLKTEKTGEKPTVVRISEDEKTSSDTRAEILNSAFAANERDSAWEASAQQMSIQGKSQPAPIANSSSSIPFDNVYKSTTDISADIDALSRQQANDQNARIAVLGAAAVSRRTATHRGIRPGANADEQISIRGNSRIMLELIVDQQNKNIGKRNIHMMKAGSRLAIGGGQSSFLVFLVKFPPKIAEVRFDGTSCDLAILKPEYFPAEQENVIHDCVNKQFEILSDRDYELTFTLRLYEDPVVQLNRLLTSIRF